MWAFLLSLASKVPGLLAGPVSQLVTGINLAQVLGNVVSFLKAVVNNVKTYWRFYLPVLLVLTQLGTAYGWYSTHNQLLKEKAAHQLDISKFKDAQKAADDKAQAEKSILQKESKANADQADASYATLYSQYRSVLLRYNQARSSATEQSDNHQLPPAQGGNGPSASTQVPAGSITITLDDANVCAINTARLQAVHDWALNPPKDGTQ